MKVKAVFCALTASLFSFFACADSSLGVRRIKARGLSRSCSDAIIEFSDAGTLKIALQPFLDSHKLSNGSPRYTLISTLGEGGFGAVYHAFDHQLGIDVAIKISEEASQSLDGVEFSRELHKKYGHQSPLLTVFDYKNFGDSKVITISEWLPTGDFSSLMTNPIPAGNTITPFPIEALSDELLTFTRIASGLDIIHRNGRLFTDLKPSNISLLGDGQVKFMDLDSLTIKTRTGVSLRNGKPIASARYASPELKALIENFDTLSPHARGVLAQNISNYSDAYSFGMIIKNVIANYRRYKDRISPTFEKALQAIEDDLVGPLTIENPDNRMSIETAQRKIEVIKAALDRKIQINSN